MKNKKTLVLAASILTLTLSALPHHAAASSTATPPLDSQALRRAGGDKIKYMETTVVLAADFLLSALRP